MFLCQRSIEIIYYRKVQFLQAAQVESGKVDYGEDAPGMATERSPRQGQGEGSKSRASTAASSSVTCSETLEALAPTRRGRHRVLGHHQVRNFSDLEPVKALLFV
jgi:hypothetical protein